MYSCFRLVARTIAKFSIGTLFLALFSFNASAQSTCTTTYSGCQKCRGSIWYQFSSQPYEAQQCWTNASQPQPWKDFWIGDGRVLCQATSPLPSRTTCTEPPQPSDPNVRNVYRFYFRTPSGNVSDHFSILDFNAGYGWNGTYEDRLFHVLVNPIDGDMTPLYACFGSWGDHFADTDASCGGHTNQGTFGYISTIARPGYIPLYRFVRLNPWDFIETTDWNEVVNWDQGGYGVLGYVPQ